MAHDADANGGEYWEEDDEEGSDGTQHEAHKVAAETLGWVDELEELVDVDPGRHRVVVTERELVFFIGKGEAFEETRARIEIVDLLGIYSVPRISQVQIFFRARLAEPGIAAGPESEAVGFFGFEDIPYDQLAFPSVRWAIEDFRERIGQRVCVPAMRSQSADLKPY